MDKNYFKLDEENDRWLVDVPRLEMVLNEGNIVEDGDEKLIFGFGPLLIYQDEDGETIEEMSLLLATKFPTKPVEIEYDRDEEEYRYIYYKEYNDNYPFCTTLNLVKDITNVEYMFNMIASGKVSTKVDWRHYIQVILNNMVLNKELDVAQRDIEIMLAEYLRDAEDPTKPVRLTDNEDYTILSFRELTSVQSTMASVGFEDPKSALTASLTRKEHEETPSPLEKYMRV